MKTTVLLLSVDEAEHLRHSLPAALAQDEVDVVVVDNGSEDDTAAVARAHGAAVLRFEPRLSYAAAINRALHETGGEAVLLLNADCFMAAGFVAAARARLDDPGVGSVAPKLLRAAGPDRPLGQIDAASMTIDRRRKNGLVGHGAPPGAYDVAGECFGADGAAALYRRATLVDCALAGEVLDEDMALWASDADLAWRARLLGWRCAYEPGAVALHVRTYSPSTRAGLPAAHRRLQFRNRLLMVAKNERGRELMRHAPFVLAWEALALGHALLRERELLGAYREAWTLRAGVLRRRRLLRARARDRMVERVPFGLAPPRRGQRAP